MNKQDYKKAAIELNKFVEAFATERLRRGWKRQPIEVNYDSREIILFDNFVFSS